MDKQPPDGIVIFAYKEEGFFGLSEEAIIELIQQRAKSRVPENINTKALFVGLGYARQIERGSQKIHAQIDKIYSDTPSNRIPPIYVIWIIDPIELPLDMRQYMEEGLEEKDILPSYDSKYLRNAKNHMMFHGKLGASGKEEIEKLARLFTGRMNDSSIRFVFAEYEVYSEKQSYIIGHFISESLILITEDISLKKHQETKLVERVTPTSSTLAQKTLHEADPPHQKGEFSEFINMDLSKVVDESLAIAIWDQDARNKFYDCLVYAYDRHSLAIPLGLTLNKDLDALVNTGQPYNNIVLDLIRCAERENWIDDLIRATHEHNERSPCLTEFAQKTWRLPA